MNVLRTITAFWQQRSLRFWLATGMLMTLCPIYLAAVIGHFVYHQAIIQPLLEVSSQHRRILQPLQSVRMSLGDISNAVIDYVVDGDPQHRQTYRKRVDEIDFKLPLLAEAVPDDRMKRDLNAVWDDWKEVVAASGGVLAGASPHSMSSAGQQVEESEAKMNRMDDDLERVYDDVYAHNEDAYNEVLSDLEASERSALAAFVVSIVFAILGVALINQSLVNSMDKLSAGALRLAAGDRTHNVEVHVPRELFHVAEAFNLMTSQIARQEEALSRAARTDGLTGLYNRREFDRLLNHEIQRGNRYGTSFSLLIGDIDHFKRFNDTRGHQAGDEALRAVARTLANELRDVDRAFRFGGEEFVLILPECDAEAALQTAERLRAAVEALEIDLEGKATARVTMSLGMASYPVDGVTPQSLLKNADSALYLSKHQGRNRVTSAGAALIG